MHHPARIAVFAVSLAMVANSEATELHTFDFSDPNSHLVENFDGFASGSYTSIGSDDEITLSIAAGLGLLDFSSALGGSGGLGINASGANGNGAQSISLRFTSLYGAPIRIHSITMTSAEDIGSPYMRTMDLLLDPNNLSQSLYRYTNGQSILLGQYDIPEMDVIDMTIDNLQYGYHSVQSVTIASASFTGSVPEPSAAIVLFVGILIIGGTTRVRGSR